MENLHEGHRKKIEGKVFSETGLDGFEEHEILELVFVFWNSKSQYKRYCSSDDNQIQ